ncbi:hypothetical protein J6590_044527 [Homalodisca vitripennis]|nr:hypothetical protein J6590_044527 [Homalodisca vitripennis]
MIHSQRTKIANHERVVNKQSVKQAQHAANSTTFHGKQHNVPRQTAQRSTATVRLTLKQWRPSEQMSAFVVTCSECVKLASI